MARVLRIGTSGLLGAVRACFDYEAGSDRATGYLYPRWPEPFATLGPWALEEVERLSGVRFPIVAFQAYKDGAGCPLHVDEPFGDQVILSLGVTRTFCVGGETIQVADGDLVFVPSGCEHGVPVEDVTGERCSLVFRIPR